MPQAPPDTHVGRCKSCGQPALLPDALDLMVVCPRCGTEAKAAELLLLATPEPTTSRRSHDPEFVNAATILAMRAPDDAAAKSRGDSARQRANGLLVTLDRLNRFVGGRRCSLFATLVAGFGISLPIVDHYLSNGRVTFTIVFGDLLLIWLWLLLFSWTTSLRDESGKWRASRLGAGFSALFCGIWEAVTEWRHSTTASKLRVLGLVLLWVGVAQLAAHGTMTVFATVMGPSTPQTSALPLIPWWLGTLTVGASLGVLLWLALEARRARSARAAGEQGQIDDLPAVVDLRRTGPNDFGSTDTRHVVLRALVQWNGRTRKRYGSRDAYLAALVRHLRRVTPSLSIRREVWLGRAREMGVVDLVISNQLLVHVQKGFDQDAADWSLAQLREYQLTRPKSPKLLLVFDAEGNQLQNKAVESALEQMHQQANAVAVRL